MENVKLRDIAEAVGVSTVTVSNALSGKKGVSGQMRDHIESVARQMGYDMSRYETRSQGVMIGVLVSADYFEVGNSFYWALYQQVVQAAAKAGSMTTLEIIDDTNRSHLPKPRIQENHLCDALIIIGYLFEPYVRQIVEHAQVPVVLLDFQVRGLACDCVMSANYVGMYKVTRYLLERGHRRIAFVGSIYANENIMDRYFGFRKAMEEYEIPVHKGWRLEDRDLVNHCMNVTLPDEMPTAFAASGDLAAQFTFEALQKKGIRVPDDVSLISYDNYLPWNDLSHHLTTYNVDLAAMAEMAVRRVLGKGHGEETHYGIRYVPGKIVVRDSVKALS